jgi:hypothetical protein
MALTFVPWDGLVLGIEVLCLLLQLNQHLQEVIPLHVVLLSVRDSFFGEPPEEVTHFLWCES